MSRFLTGFVTATLLWGGIWAAQAAGLFGPAHLEVGTEPEQAEGKSETVESDDERNPDRRRRRRRRRARRRDRDREHVPQGIATTGQDLGADEPQTIRMGKGGGQEQLRKSRIEQGFDENFGQIRRCLVLAAGNAPVKGKLVFGLRIAGSGQVTRVNLKGPAAITKGESGTCLRRVARSMQFPSFNGPDMVVHYPVTLE